jgi:hypothetical protein
MSEAEMEGDFMVWRFPPLGDYQGLNDAVTRCANDTADEYESDSEVVVLDAAAVARQKETTTQQ